MKLSRRGTIRMRIPAMRATSGVRITVVIMGISMLFGHSRGVAIDLTILADRRLHALTGCRSAASMGGREARLRPSGTSIGSPAAGVSQRTFQGWWAMTGSNRRPSRCKRDALPTELIARPIDRRLRRDGVAAV